MTQTRALSLIQWAGWVVIARSCISTYHNLDS